MEMKKKFPILIVLIILSLILLIGIVIFFQYHPKLDKYNDYQKECNINIEGFNLYLKCSAFLTRMVQTQDPYSCYDFIIVKDNTSIREDKICEMDDKVNDSDQTLYTELKVPVDLTFEYTRDSLFAYTFTELEIKYMGKEKALDIIQELKRNEIEITSVKIIE